MELPLGCYQRFSAHAVPHGHEWRWTFPSEWVVWVGSPPADWQSALGMGDIWFLGSRLGEAGGEGSELWSHLQWESRQTEVPNATQRCTVSSLKGGTSGVTVPEACCNYTNLRLLFLLQYFWCHWYCVWIRGVGLLDTGQGFTKMSHRNQIITLLCSFDCVCDPTQFV